MEGSSYFIDTRVMKRAFSRQNQGGMNRVDPNGADNGEEIFILPELLRCRPMIGPESRTIDRTFCHIADRWELKYFLK